MSNQLVHASEQITCCYERFITNWCFAN